MKVIYIAAPFTTKDEEQFEVFKHAARFYGMMVANLGAMPLMPTTNTGYGFRQINNYGFWLVGIQELLKKCDAMFIVPGSVSVFKSQGVLAEISTAERLGIPVFDTVRGITEYIQKKSTETG